MHEQSLMNDLMKKILALAAKENAVSVTKVSVRLGALSHMPPQHFKEHFDEVAKGTIAEYAVLEAIEDQNVNDPHAQTILLKSIDVSD